MKIMPWNYDYSKKVWGTDIYSKHYIIALSELMIEIKKANNTKHSTEILATIIKEKNIIFPFLGNPKRISHKKLKNKLYDLLNNFIKTWNYNCEILLSIRNEILYLPRLPADLIVYEAEPALETFEENIKDACEKARIYFETEFQNAAIIDNHFYNNMRIVDNNEPTEPSQTILKILNKLKKMNNIENEIIDIESTIMLSSIIQDLIKNNIVKDEKTALQDLKEFFKRGKADQYLGYTILPFNPYSNKENSYNTFKRKELKCVKMHDSKEIISKVYQKYCESLLVKNNKRIICEDISINDLINYNNEKLLELKEYYLKGVKPVDKK